MTDTETTLELHQTETAGREDINEGNADETGPVDDTLVVNCIHDYDYDRTDDFNVAYEVMRTMTEVSM